MSIEFHTEDGKMIECEYNDEDQKLDIIGKREANEIGLFFDENEGCVFGCCEPDPVSSEVVFS